MSAPIALGQLPSGSARSAPRATSSVAGMTASAANWDRGLRGSRPTRSDDTVVISGSRRATKAEVLALIEADVAAREAEQRRDG